jgi:beta-xylosidase
MRHTSILAAAAGLANLVLAHRGATKNTTYNNPIIPGFHPDPSCIFVREWDNTFFCATSSFIAFPAMPVFASKDLVNWKLISHVQNRPEQFLGAGNITRNDGGWYAPTLRFHQGTFYVINVDVNAAEGTGSGIFTTENPYDNDAWSNLLEVDIGGYDPDLFFDADGTVYSQAAITIISDPFTTDIQQFTIDLATGETTPRQYISGNASVVPAEGPHLYYKDDYYWLLLAEGGTALEHQVSIARSKSPSGPWERDPANPIQTAINTTSLFQTVGHADLFQDAAGNWWGVALTTRSGPEYLHWPMNRETVLYPVSWPKDQWPVADRVEGIMSGPLPPRDLNIPGVGPFVKDPDYYTFPRGSLLPRHFTFWRFPHVENYVISPPGHANRLRLTPSNYNLTANITDAFDPLAGQTFIGRRQTDTLFQYSVDMEFRPSCEGEEAGVTVFLRQEANAELGVVHLDGKPQLRFRAEGPDAPPTVVQALPNGWKSGLTLQIKAFNFTHYSLSAGLKGSKHLQTLALLNNSMVSTSFTGVFVGVYATTNGNGKGGTPAYFGNWKYQGKGQAISNGAYYPSNGQKKNWW